MPEASQSLRDEFAAWNTENAERIAALNDQGLGLAGINEVVTQTFAEFILGRMGGEELVLTARLEAARRTRALIESAEEQAPAIIEAQAAELAAMRAAQARAVLTSGIGPPANGRHV